MTRMVAAEDAARKKDAMQRLAAAGAKNPSLPSLSPSWAWPGRLGMSERSRTGYKGGCVGCSPAQGRERTIVMSTCIFPATISLHRSIVPTARVTLRKVHQLYGTSVTIIYTTITRSYLRQYRLHWFLIATGGVASHIGTRSYMNRQQCWIDVQWINWLFINNTWTQYVQCLTH